LHTTIGASAPEFADYGLKVFAVSACRDKNSVAGFDDGEALDTGHSADARYLSPKTIP
jgi:hypothetical protein